MTDIVINGVSLDTLKAQRAEIQKGAAKWIAGALNRVNELNDKFEDESFTIDEAEALAPQLKSILDYIQAVSDATGVEYELDYISTDEPAYREENFSWKDYYKRYPNLNALSNTFNDMRHQQSVWNGSAC